MAMFQQYQNGIQPVTGMSEAGANIGKMYGNAISSVGENLAKGIEQYHKNKSLNESADVKLGVMADDFAQRIQMFSSSPELAPFAKIYEPLQKKMEKAHTLNLPQKIALLHEVETLNSRADKEFAFFNIVKTSRENQLIPDAIEAAKAGTTTTVPLASNPKDVKYNPTLTFDQNEQEARRYYRDIRAKSPTLELKAEDDWINEWRKALPRVLQSDTKLHPVVRASAIEQIEKALADIDAGPDSNIDYYLSRYADLPIPTNSGTTGPAPVTTATPAGTMPNGVKVDSNGVPTPVYASPAPAQVAPAPVAVAPTPALPTPPSRAMPAQPVAPAAPIVIPPQSVTKAASPVIIPPTPAPVRQQAQAPVQAPVQAPAMVAPAQATAQPQPAPTVSAPAKVETPAPVQATATPALPPPPSQSKPVEKKKQEPKYVRKEGSGQVSGQTGKWYIGKNDSIVAFAYRNKVDPYDVAEQNGLPLNANSREVDAVAEKNGGELMIPVKRDKTGKLDFADGTSGPTGEMGMEGEAGDEGQPEEPIRATNPAQQAMGRDIFVEDSQKLYLPYIGARTSREYLQTLQNNVEIGSGSGLPTGAFNQMVKQNPDLWRSLAFGAKTSLEVHGATRIGTGIKQAIEGSKSLTKLTASERETLYNQVNAEMTRLLRASPKLQGLPLDDPKIQSLFNKAVDAVRENKSNVGITKALQGGGLLLAGAGAIDGSIEDKFDLPDEIRRTGPAWNVPYGGTFVDKTLDEIRAIGTGDLTSTQRARINQLLVQKIAEAKKAETAAETAWKTHFGKASPEAFSASYAGAALPDAKKRAESIVSPIPRISLNPLVNEQQPSLEMPAMTMGVKTIRQAPNLDEKRTQMKEFFQSRLGYVPSSFESIIKASFPEASLSFQETPYGVMMHDGKDWKPLSSGKTLQPHEIASNRAVTFGQMMPDGSMRGEELVPNSGIKVSGIGAFGSPSDATKFRNEYPRLIRAKNALIRLQAINDKFGKSIDLTLRGQAAILTKEIIAQLRTEIVGVGTVSNFEQGILQDIVQNPADIFHWTSTTGAKYAQLLEQVNESLKTMPAQYGLSVDMKDDRVKEIEAARAYWRKATQN